jgi:hypothetical protein
VRRLQRVTRRQTMHGSWRLLFVPVLGWSVVGWLLVGLSAADSASVAARDTSPDEARLLAASVCACAVVGRLLIGCWLVCQLLTARDTSPEDARPPFVPALSKRWAIFSVSDIFFSGLLCLFFVPAADSAFVAARDTSPEDARL